MHGSSGALPSDDPHHLAHRLILRYLTHVGYSQTREAFEREALVAGRDLASHSPSASSVAVERKQSRQADGTPDSAEVIDDLLSVTETYISHQMSLQKHSIVDAKQQAALSILSQTLPGPSSLPYRLQRTHGELHTSNILSIKLLYLPRRYFDSAIAEYRKEWRRCFVTTAADKRIVFSDVQSGEILEVMEGAHKAAVLAVAQVGEEDGVHGETACGRLNAVRRRLLASAGMDGSVVLYDCFNGKHVQTLRHHNKFVVRVAFDASGRYLASAGYDRRINIYRAVASSNDGCYASDETRTARHDSDEDTGVREEEEDPKDLAVSYELVHTIETASNPEAILFVPNAKERQRRFTAMYGSGAEVQSGEVTDSQNNAVQLDLRDWLVYTIRGDCFLHYVALPTHRQVESVRPCVAASEQDGTSLFSAGPGSLEDCLRKLNVQSSAPSSSPQGPTTKSNEERVIADWEELRYNTNPSRDDYHVSYSLLDLALHPSGMYLSAQTGDHAFSSSLSQSGITSSFAASPTSLSRLLLMPVHSDVRAATLWTAAPYSPYVSPRHAWMPSGRGACVNGEDGSVRLVDLQGKVRAVIYAHGQPASSAGDGLRSSVEWSRGGRGNTIVKDVVALDECTIASCGFDRTVRVCTLAS